MAKERIKVVQRKAKAHVLHEFNEKGQHRIVLVGEEGNDVSGWAEQHAVGEFKGYLYSAGHYPLRHGVFRQVMVEARTLNSRQEIFAGEAKNAEAPLKSARRR